MGYKGLRPLADGVCGRQRLAQGQAHHQAVDLAAPPALHTRLRSAPSCGPGLISV